MSHTPGPWVFDDGDNWTIRDADGEFVSYITKSRYCDEREDPTANANARLIAAAPDLLAFARHVADLHPDEPLGEDARALIARAEGK